jgi:hypothetical protein
VLILCEDEKSAKFYFDGFPIDRERYAVQTVGTGRNTDSLVEEAIRRKGKAEKSGQPFNEIYCVFDRDDFPARNFNRAFELAASHGIHAIWANEAFELWYLLHYDLIVTAISRHDYPARLARKLGFRYRKNDRCIYRHLLARQEQAFIFSRRLAKHWVEMRGRCVAEQCNPSTNIPDLVAFLNQLSELGPADGA